MNRVLIILAGSAPSPELFRKTYNCCDFRIAADSGMNVFLENNAMPHILTGDFDSIKELPPPNSPVKIIPAPEPSATDFEKALTLVEEDDWKELIILGGMGGRHDHFLTNLLIASQINPTKKVSFIDDYQEIHRITPECPFAKKEKLNTVISLIPFTRAIGVTTSGFRWDLSASDMYPPVLLGQSNFNIEENIFANIKEGMLYLVINTEKED